jgi:succinylglutamate desuccinylase
MNSLEWTDDIPPDRLLGAYTSGLPGPLILAIGGVHGNEPNGPRAIRAFLNMLHTQTPLISGTFLGVIGNVRAFGENQRFIDKDLNRCFTATNVAAGHSSLLGHEASELHEIVKILHRARDDFEDVCFVDCHTTSAQTMPYLSINVHTPSIQLAHRFPLNSVIGLQKSIPGCLTEYCNALDFRGFTFEAGQHQGAAAFSNQVAMLWLLLVYSGALSKHDLPAYRHYEKLLGVETPELKRSFRLLSHYSIKEGENFVMRPGFRNFDYVTPGTHLADNRYGAIYSPDEGYILMPLYQKQGSDGFFLLEEEGAYAFKSSVSTARY